MSASAASIHPAGRAVGSPAARRRRFALWRPPTAIAAVVLGVVGGQAAALALVFLAGSRDRVNVFDGIALVLGDAILLTVVVLFARRGANLAPATLGIRRTRFWRAVGWALLIFIGTLALEGIWSLIVGGSGTRRDAGGAPGGSPSALVVVLVMFGVAVTAPIAEEIAFRGYLFAALTSWRGPWIATLVTAVLFGAAHIAAAPPQMLPALAAFGFGACMLYWFTGSLLPGVGIHALNNGLVMGALAGFSWQVPLIAIAAVVLSICLLLPFARERAPVRRHAA